MTSVRKTVVRMINEGSFSIEKVFSEKKSYYGIVLVSKPVIHFGKRLIKGKGRRQI